jgi:hypothetical protein
MWRWYAVIAAVWVALSPPFFTGGACTEEFDAVERRLMADSAKLRSAPAAAEHTRSLAWPTTVLSPERCREAKPRVLDRCGGSTFVIANVPVKNKICSFYRDSDVRIVMEYSDKGQLQRLRTDMDPYKSLPIPFTGKTLHWAR